MLKIQETENGRKFICIPKEVAEDMDLHKGDELKHILIDGLFAFWKKGKGGSGSVC